MPKTLYYLFKKPKELQRCNSVLQSKEAHESLSAQAGCVLTTTKWWLHADPLAWERPILLWLCSSTADAARR